MKKQFSNYTDETAQLFELSISLVEKRGLSLLSPED